MHAERLGLIVGSSNMCMAVSSPVGAAHLRKVLTGRSKEGDIVILHTGSTVLNQQTADLNSCHAIYHDGTPVVDSPCTQLRLFTGPTTREPLLLVRPSNHSK